MARKKLDKLSKDMIQCAKDGFGVHYGRWKATQEVVAPVKVDKTPKNWKTCPVCGEKFKPKGGKVYCSDHCRYTANLDKEWERREKNRVYLQEYRAKKRAEKNGA